MRILLLGAFTYPHEQGSQVYFQEQAIALRAAGAEIHLQSYGPAAARSSGPAREDVDRWRALDGFPHTTLPAWAAPSSRRSGPHPGKPFADLCLAVSLRRTLRGRGLEPASTASFSSLRRGVSPFDVILAHHAEAALLALHTLPKSRPPVLYCAHTLLEQELPEYFKPSRVTADPTSMRQRALASLGRVIDQRIARQADGWLALTRSSARVIGAASERPGRRIAPPIADPELDPERPDAEAVARFHGLVPGGFFLYSGNLDPYQDLPLLERVARERRPRESARRGVAGPRDARLPIVIATHDERASKLATRAAGSGESRLCVRRLHSTGEAQALVAAARASIVPRRSLGGFPIKLANSLAAGTPVVAFHAEEWGLEDGRDCLLGGLAAPVTSFARALDRLEDDPALAARLGVGARATYLAHHRPDRVAAETLALVETLLSRR